MMDVSHFDGMGVKILDCRQNSPAAVSGMVQPGYRVAMIDDVDVTHLSADQLLEILKLKTTVKLCLKSQSASQSYFDSKSATSSKPSISSEDVAEVQSPLQPTVSKAAGVFLGKLKSASQFFSSTSTNSQVPILPSSESESITRKTNVRFSEIVFVLFKCL
jgi:hypothetical protein